MMVPVHIRKVGTLLQIYPSMADLLGPELEFKRRTQTGATPGSVEYERIKMYRTCGNPEYMVTPAGLYARVVRKLKSFNISFTFEDARPLKLESPDWAALEEPREGQDVILAKIATCHTGQIEAPTGDGKTWIIVQVCKMYPTTRIVIVVPGVDIAKTIRDRLLSEIPADDVGQLGGGRKERGRRVTVCVRNSLEKADLDHCRLLLYDECHTAAGAVTSKDLTHAFDCKRFGFSASTEMRSDNADMMVEALFGPVIHVTTYQQSQKRGNVVPLRVIMRGVGTGPVIHTSSSAVLNRHGLWRNKHRNRLIAEDALAHSAHGEQVLISVGTVEHGLELMRHLKGSFSFVYSTMSKALRKRYEKEKVIVPGEHPITQKERLHMQAEFEAGRLLRVISTCWNQGVDFRNLQVLIRADGIGSNIRSVQLPGRLSRTADGKSFGLLIDYMDEFDARLYRRAQKRLRLYRKKGWDIQVPPKQLGLHIRD